MLDQSIAHTDMNESHEEMQIKPGLITVPPSSHKGWCWSGPGFVVLLPPGGEYWTGGGLCQARLHYLLPNARTEDGPSQIELQHLLVCATSRAGSRLSRETYVTPLPGCMRAGTEVGPGRVKLPHPLVHMRARMGADQLD